MVHNHGVWGFQAISSRKIITIKKRQNFGHYGTKRVKVVCTFFEFSRISVSCDATKVFKKIEPIKDVKFLLQNKNVEK